MTSTHGRTPMYGSQTPMYGTGSRTPMYGSQTPLHDGETHTPTKGVPLWTSVRLYTHDRSRACSHCGDSCSPQGAVLLTTARRRRCMMGAGRQGRAERGIPTTPTHRPGRLHVLAAWRPSLCCIGLSLSCQMKGSLSYANHTGSVHKYDENIVLASSPLNNVSATKKYSMKD